MESLPFLSLFSPLIRNGDCLNWRVLIPRPPSPPLSPSLNDIEGESFFSFQYLTLMSDPRGRFIPLPFLFRLKKIWRRKILGRLLFFSPPYLHSSLKLKEMMRRYVRTVLLQRPFFPPSSLLGSFTENEDGESVTLFLPSPTFFSAVRERGRILISLFSSIPVTPSFFFPPPLDPWGPGSLVRTPSIPFLFSPFSPVPPAVR